MALRCTRDGCCCAATELPTRPRAVVLVQSGGAAFFTGPRCDMTDTTCKPTLHDSRPRVLSLAFAAATFTNNSAPSGSALFVNNVAQTSLCDTRFTLHGGATIVTQSARLSWYCRLGSWMPSTGDISFDLAAPECKPCTAGYFGDKHNETKDRALASAPRATSAWRGRSRHNLVLAARVC